MKQSKILQELETEYLKGQKQMNEAKEKLLRIKDGHRYLFNVNDDSAYWKEVYPNYMAAKLAAIEHHAQGHYVDVKTTNPEFISFAEHHNREPKCSIPYPCLFVKIIE